MPGVDRLGVDEAVREAGELVDLGIPGRMLFGIPAHKDEEGTGAYDDEGIVQLAARAIKQAYPDLIVVGDVCLCEYTSHGHCGLLTADGRVDNDATLELLSRTASSTRWRSTPGIASIGLRPFRPASMKIGRSRSWGDRCVSRTRSRSAGVRRRRRRRVVGKATT
jgi:porphobilinogen synthase